MRKMKKITIEHIISNCPVTRATQYSNPRIVFQCFVTALLNNSLSILFKDLNKMTILKITIKTDPKSLFYAKRLLSFFVEVFS